MDRRDFLKDLGAGAGVLAAMPWLASCTSEKMAEVSHEKARVALIGSGSRGQYHIHMLREIPHAELVAICDDYTPNLLGWEGTATKNNVQYKAVKFLNGINNTTKRWNGCTISVDCDAETIVEEILKLR